MEFARLSLLLAAIGAPDAADGALCVAIADFEVNPLVATVAVQGTKLVVGLPEQGVVYLLETDAEKKPRLVRALRAPDFSGFADGPGFGSSVAIDAHWLVVGAARTWQRRPQDASLEFPEGLFTTGALYRFTAEGSDPEELARTTPIAAVGHTVALRDGAIYYGVFEKPAATERLLSLRRAARGRVDRIAPNGGMAVAIAPPSDMAGFGAILSGNDQLLTLAWRESYVTVWSVTPNGAVENPSLGGALNGQPVAYVAAADGWKAVAAPGGWSADLARTSLIAPDGTQYILPHGGPLSLSGTRLAILQHALPEGASHNILYLYKLSDRQSPKLVHTIGHVVGATVSANHLIFVTADPSGRVHICRY